MTDFINRQQEIATLNQLIHGNGPQFTMVYGRRRVGKTTLLTTWAARTGLPTFYWVAKRESRAVLMSNLAQQVWAWEHGQDRSDIELRPADWDAALAMLAKAIGKRKCIVILDELPYLLESDPAFASYLQAAWDHRFKQSQAQLFVSGSHVGMMTRLLEYQAPLYGRFTSQLPILPLSFPDIASFLPGYDVHKRLAVYAILGGIPAYLERWQSRQSLAANIERLFLQRTGWFRNEPMVLVSDLTQRETETYEAVLRAIAAGQHTRDEIAGAAIIPATSLSHYLPRLLDLGLIERRVPATVPIPKRQTSRTSRYFLRDSYLRFYYRFVDPNLHLIEQGLSQRLWASLTDQFRAFVAATFEDLCRTWTLAQAQQGLLPFEPDIIGQHWAPDAQVDVVAVNWKAKKILLGEAKWGEGKVGREVVQALVNKTQRVVPDRGEGWEVFYAFFAREGFSEPARLEAAKYHSLLLTLADMEPGLRLHSS
jgi:AAA+ ATPase superfamily predicted ATPase